MKTGHFVTHLKIPFNMGSGLCDILGQDAGTVLPVNVRCSPSAFSFHEKLNSYFPENTIHCGHLLNHAETYPKLERKYLQYFFNRLFFKPEVFYP